MKRTTYRPKIYQPRRCSCGRAMTSSEILVGRRTLHFCQPCADAWWREFLEQKRA